MGNEQRDGSAIGIIAVVVALLLALPCLLVVVGAAGFFWLRVDPTYLPTPAPPPVVAPQPAPVIVPQPFPGDTATPEAQVTPE